MPKTKRLRTDRWGIDNGYHDPLKEWHLTSADTRDAVLAAMGVVDDQADVPGADSVRLIRAGQQVAWPEPGELRLEDGTTLSIEGSLPPDLPLGYHAFHSAGRAAPTRLIVFPPKCLLPPQRQWGWAVQLYALRSHESWGIGDLGDLRRLAAWSSGLGAGLLLINPLHAPAPLLPQEGSPYHPSSRRYRNPLFLRVEEVPGAGCLGPKLAQLAASGRSLNNQRLIQRDAVYRTKHEALRAIWDQFSGDETFDRYCRQEGPALGEFAVYCVLAEQWGEDWRRWPEAFRSPRRAEVGRFAAQHARQVGYHQWLQWLLDRQLAAAAAVSPIVQDLAVGFAPGGADAWAWQDVLGLGCSVGAPPDLFNTLGQNWDLPPFVPHKLRAAGYQPFIETLRAALRHSGGLRMDHVMGLFRLFWIPHGFHPQEGTYVRYQADELLAIVALESHRAGAFIVGEDLGNVEPDVRRRLRQRQILSSRILWLEERPPRDYPELALVAATTHDLPTIAGLWTGADKAAQLAADSRPNESMARLRREFGRWLRRADDTPVAAVIEEAYRLLAEAPSLVILATLEDALAVEERPNMPGTTTQWPNWSLALPGGLEAIQTAELPRRIAERLNRSGPLLD
jgi:4-alpha-glucanotransferase